MMRKAAQYLFLATVIPPLLGVRTLNKYSAITLEPPISVMISVFTQGIGTYKPLLDLPFIILPLL